MKKHVVICGAGKMGAAIGYAVKSLGMDLSVVDADRSNIDKFIEVNGSCPAYDTWAVIKDNIDVVISALPYHVTLQAADWAVANDIRYCDLGGSVPVSKSINDLASRKATKPVMTDLGLAPGWINIMAEELWRENQDVNSIVMMVGGIPPFQSKDDPLNYKLTWSTDGLLNEYKDECDVLESGKCVKVPGMSRLEEVWVGDMHLEAFCTSGASAHSVPLMAGRGVRHCCYKTLRWPGHCRLMRHMLKCLDDKSIEKVLVESSKNHRSDLVILYVSGQNDISTKTKRTIVTPSRQFTAMQRATAFPISVIAYLMAAGEMDDHKCPNYSHVNLKAFNNALQSLLCGNM